MTDSHPNHFMARFCPGCGAEIDEQPIGWAAWPLNDDLQAWAVLCIDCFKKAYPHED